MDYETGLKFLEYHKFDNRIEEIIWEYHIHGMTVRNIADTLMKAGIANPTPTMREVGETIRKLYTIMKKNQLN